jgi:hypothetical protein
MIGDKISFNINRIMTYTIKQSSRKRFESLFVREIKVSSFIKPVVTLIGFEEGDKHEEFIIR